MITVKYDKPKKLKAKQSIFVSFPYKAKIVDVMRTFYGRYYHADTKTWELDYSSLDEIKRQLPNEEFTVIGKPISNKKFNEKEVDRTISLPKNLKTKLYEYQKEAFYEGVAYDKFILNLEQGLGKSLVALAIMSKRKELGQIKRCLVLPCVSGLRYTWQNEINKHTKETSLILGARKNSADKLVVRGNKDKIEDIKKLNSTSPTFIITNIESLRDSDLVKELKKKIRSGLIDSLIVDEIHLCKSVSSQQGRGLMQIGKLLDYILELTGTILVNKPLDLYMPLKLADREEATYTAFKHTYGVWGGWGGYQLVGYKHLDILKDKLNSVSKRLTKYDVLDLPPKIYIDEYVDMGTKQTKIYNEVLNSVLENIDNISESVNPLSMLIRLRQATADTSILSSTIKESVKFSRAEELIDDIISDGNSVIVFSNWSTVISNFRDMLSNKYGKIAFVTGQVQDRESQIDLFMKDDECHIFLATCGSAGTGYTLTKANTVIFLDEPWSASQKHQNEDRAHRIGQNSSVNVITIMCKNTIDENIHKIVKRKDVMSEALVDNKFDLRNKDLLNYLCTGEGEFS